MDVIDGKNPGLVSHKGFLVIKGLHDPDAVDMIRNLEIKESDVLVVTYPKSGEENKDLRSLLCFLHLKMCHR